MSVPTNHLPTHFWKQQSPIALNRETSIYVRTPASYLKFDYRDAPFQGRFSGEGPHANFVLEKPHQGKHLPILRMGNVAAELVKIHLHTPSEHDIEGRDQAGEIHLIHRLASPVNGSELVVVGVFFKEGKSREHSVFFSKWAAQLKPVTGDDPAEDLTTIDPRTLLPKKSISEPWYRYEGSLTSEPYSETVSWLVFVNPIEAHTSDLEILNAHAHQPERSVQPLNRRFVLRNFQ